MTVTEVATLAFKDLDSGDEAYIFVTVNGRIAGLGLALKEDGDMEVSFDAGTLEKLLAALEDARRLLQR